MFFFKMNPLPFPNLQTNDKNRTSGVRTNVRPTPIYCVTLAKIAETNFAGFLPLKMKVSMSQYAIRLNRIEYPRPNCDYFCVKVKPILPYNSGSHWGNLRADPPGARKGSHSFNCQSICSPTQRTTQY